MPHQCTTCGRTFPDGSKEMLAGCPDCGGNKFQFAPSLETRTSKRDGSASTDSPREASGSGAGTSARRRQPADQRHDRRERTHPTEWGRDDSQGDRGDESEWEWPESAKRPEDRTRSSEERAASSKKRPPSSKKRPPSSTDRSAANENRPPSSSSANARRSDRTSADESVAARSTDTGSPDTGSPDTGSPDEGFADTGSQDTDSKRTPSTADTDSTDSESEDAAQASARSDVVPSDELPAADQVDRPDPERGRVVSEPAADQPSLEELREELNQQFESIKIVNPGQYELNLMELYNRDEYIISLQEDGRYVIDVPDSWRQSEE